MCCVCLSGAPAQPGATSHAALLTVADLARKVAEAIVVRELGIVAPPSQPVVACLPEQLQQDFPGSILLARSLYRMDPSEARGGPCCAQAACMHACSRHLVGHSMAIRGTMSCCASEQRQPFGMVLDLPHS